MQSGSLDPLRFLAFRLVLDCHPEGDGVMSLEIPS